MDITFPTDIPIGAKYYKVDANGFYEFLNAVIIGSTVTLTLSDTGDRVGGDSNGIAGDGVIDDPGGVALAVIGDEDNSSDSDSDSSGPCFISTVMK